MKRNSTLVLLIFLLNSLPLLAAAPTVPASNLSFSNLDGTSFQLSFQRGNGASRIVVLKAGSPVTGMPVDGANYTANANFGTAGTEFTGPGEFVVYKGNGNSFVVNRLNPATTYHISVFEFNGSGASTQYLMIPLTGSQATVSTPTTQVTMQPFSAVIGNSVTLNWTNGNGGRRLVLARKGAPVTATPEDLRNYSYNPNFGEGTVINGDNYVVYAGTNNKATVTNLEPNTLYHFAVFEYSGINAPMYLIPGATASVTTNAGPTSPSQSINFNGIEGNGVTISFSAGNGKHQLIIAKKNSPVTAVPVNGATYTANSQFGLGTEIAPGEFVLNTTGNIRKFTNMDPATVYHFRIFEFDITSTGQTYYLTSAFGEKSQSTAVPPTTPSSGLNFTNVTGNAATLRYTSGNGAYRLSVIKEGSPVDAVPVDLIKYSGSGVFGSGAEIAPGNYALSNANGSAVNITNLTPGRTYHVAVFEFNGLDFPVYLRPAATHSITLSAQPTQPATAFFTNFVEGDAFRANWTSGNGSRRVIIAKKGSPVTARPVDGVTYTADADFGEGQEVAPGEFVVYDGTSSNVNIEELEIATTYHFAIFEYNSSATGPDYLTSSFLAATGSSASAPSTQVSAINATSIQSNQATINFVIGSGAGRIFVMREGGPVDAIPQNLVIYNANTIFGNSLSQLGVGNYVVQKTVGASAFTVTNLTPSTVYHVAAFEYNGSSGPVYLTPAETFSFTTAVGSGVTAPTIPASNPSFTSVDGNKFNFNWDNGNGSNRLVVMKEGGPVTFTPVNGTAYTANTSFGTGTDLGSGQYAIYNGVNDFVSVTNLLPGTTYHVAVFEYNGTGANTRYLTSSFLASAGSTVSVPATGSSNATSLTGNHSITLNWQSGSGSSRIVVMKQGSALTALPVNLSVYPANSVFGSGSQLGAGEYVVYSGTGNQVTVTGLTHSTTYHFRIFEFNGSDGPVYNTTNILSGSATTQAALPLKWVSFTVKESNGEAVLEWTTTNEHNTAYFVVERSVGDMKFIAIDSLQAKGSTGNNQYRFADKTKPAGTVYYRIRQVDADGKYEYSKLVRIDAAGTKKTLGIYPNPVVDVCRISLPQGMQQANVFIYDMRGVQLRSMKVQNGQYVNLGNLPAGTYSVVVRDGGAQISTQIIKK